MPPHLFQILLTLADRPLHGLAITKDVLERTEGRMHLWPGMLYGALKKLTLDGWVKEVEAPSTYAPGGGKARFYAITPAGRSVCGEEARRLAAFVDVARQKKLVPARTGRSR